MCLCFLTPHFWGTMALTDSDPLGEDLTEQWPGASSTQEHSWDRAAANAQSLWLGTSLPQKKFMQSCRSSISGIMENHNTHLAPGFTLNNLVPAPANAVVLWGLLGLGRHTASTRCPPSRGTTFLCVAQRPPDLTLFLEICPSQQSTVRY